MNELIITVLLYKDKKIKQGYLTMILVGGTSHKAFIGDFNVTYLACMRVFPRGHIKAECYQEAKY